MLDQLFFFLLPAVKAPMKQSNVLKQVTFWLDHAMPTWSILEFDSSRSITCNVYTKKYCRGN